MIGIELKERTFTNCLKKSFLSVTLCLKCTGNGISQAHHSILACVFSLFFHHNGIKYIITWNVMRLLIAIFCIL